MSGTAGAPMRVETAVCAHVLWLGKEAPQCGHFSEAMDPPLSG